MPTWTWDEDRKRFRYSSGRLVPQKYVKNDVFRLSNGVRGDLRELTRLLERGEISTAQWYRRMKVEIRLAYRAAIVVAEGGLANMTPAKWGRFGAIMKAEYKFLNRFLRDIQTGKVSGRRMIARSGLYGNSTARVYENWRLSQHIDLGYTTARRRLNVAEHCTTSQGLTGCLELANEGWMPIGDMPPIGESPCLSNCHCTIEYGNQVSL